MNDQTKLFMLAAALCALPVTVHFGLRQNSELPQSSSASVQKVENPAPRAAAKQDENFPFGTAESDDDLFRRATNAAAVSPETALALGKKLLADDPNDDSARASNLLLALCSTGNFQTAIQLANDATAGLRDNWLKVIFSRCTQANPQNAMDALDSISDSSARKAAFETAADTWAQNNPSALADFTTTLPDGDDKTFALEKIIEHWSFQDPAGFAAWLNTSPRCVDFDRAVAEMISKTDGANRPVETALSWVEAMSDSSLKLDALARVLAEWNQTNPADAQNYAVNASWLDGQQRQAILARLQTPPPAQTTDAD